MRLANKRAIVTGAAQGIGRAIAERFLKEGAKVMMADINAAAGQKSASALGASFCAADVSSKASVDALVAQTVKEFGGIDILVNNAATMHKADVFDLTEADFDRVLSVNLKGPFLLSQAAARHMAKQKSGAIINLSSINAELTIPDHIPYAVSKGGITLLTKVMALALAPHGIRVNAIGPGTVLTELSRVVLSDAAAENRVLSRTPVGRFGQPEEIAGVAVFLASDDSSYVLGQTIFADGGRLTLNYTVPVPNKA